MIDFFDSAERIKYISVNDKQYELHVTDPYGFWTIKFPKKEKVPDRLNGQYTSFKQAEDAIRAYVRGVDSAKIG